MVANLSSRLAALESRTPGANGSLAVALLSEHMSAAEQAERVASAICAWENGHKRPWPIDGRVMRVLLVAGQSEARS